MRFSSNEGGLVRNLRTFNSLYEIPFIVKVEPVGIDNFQFSLWDSKEAQFDLLKKIVDFQFSLWDSTIEISGNPLEEISTFNSLYEILGYIFFENNPTNILSILFMRFPFENSRLGRSPWAFNSLYEILRINGPIEWQQPSTFNSLYEIRFIWG